MICISTLYRCGCFFNDYICLYYMIWKYYLIFDMILWFCFVFMMTSSNSCSRFFWCSTASGFSCLAGAQGSAHSSMTWDTSPPPTSMTQRCWDWDWVATLKLWPNSYGNYGITPSYSGYHEKIPLSWARTVLDDVGWCWVNVKSLWGLCFVSSQVGVITFFFGESVGDFRMCRT